ncbi:pentapeptide repeat-containing protein [Candidatus Borrarchaeum sp.]|uniref:pentapeptide repeat-containing protein n=1 Tax=Candidatus Borrarchaeum sp. TaxID=2846742 RepID=UPI00257E861A|nr:pentapeptide repeat-containing protein [Candidatus Borrarchaeum sp.]
MSEKCRYGRDSEVVYYDLESKEIQYKCPRDAEIDGFCMFHKKGYWKHNKENEERVRKAFKNELKNTGPRKELLCIGYHLPDIQVRDAIKEIRGFVSFKDTLFQSVDFEGVTFQERADFRKTTFQERADFRRAIFQHWADFRGATFQQPANFWEVIFQQSADFSEVTFQHWAAFWDAIFQGLVVFSVSTFQHWADFKGAVFQQQAGFWHATFQQEADFSEAIFEKQVTFFKARFQQKIDFSRATFKGPALFEGVEFIPDIDIPRDNENVFINFRRIKFGQPEEIVFDSCDLSYVSFIHTDISRVNFRNITWPRPTDWKPDNFNKRISRFSKMDAYTLIDDELLERTKNGIEPHKDDQDLTIENVLTVYRMLRENYEYNVNYETAGRFFVGEMEARRRNSDSHSEKIILGLYKLLSLYGQSYNRPLYVLFGLIAWFAFLRGLILFFQGIGPLDVALEVILESFAVSLQIKGTEGIDIIQRILSIPLLVLFGLALRRRFERRFRH